MTHSTDATLRPYHNFYTSAWSVLKQIVSFFACLFRFFPLISASLFLKQLREISPSPISSCRWYNPRSAVGMSGSSCVYFYLSVFFLLFVAVGRSAKGTNSGFQFGS